MDILYIIGGGSLHDNIELRMSLRSISKYGTGIGKVIVAGQPPLWLSDEIEKIEIKDRYSYKHQNILHCIETVVEKGIVTGDFLYSSDDHFYVKPVNFDNYPVFVKCDLRTSVNKTDPYYQYHRSLYDTRILCMKYGFPTINYSQHCNTHMHSEVIKEIKEVIQESYRLPYGVEPTSIIMNAWQTHKNAPKAILREDVKILKAENIEDIYKQIGDRDCFSISDTIFGTKGIRKFFELEYGIKSIFEAD